MIVVKLMVKKELRCLRKMNILDSKKNKITIYLSIARR